MKLPVKIKTKKVDTNYYRVVLEEWQIPKDERKSVKEIMGQSASFRGRSAKADAYRFADQLREKLNLIYLARGKADKTVREVLQDFASHKNIASYNKQFRNWLKCGRVLDVDILSANIPVLVSEFHKIIVLEGKRDSVKKEIEFLRAAINYYKFLNNPKLADPQWTMLLSKFGKPKVYQTSSEDIRKAFQPEEIFAVLEAMKKPHLSANGIPHHSYEPIYYYIFKFMTLYGFRISEVVGLEWSDLSLAHNYFSLTGHIEWFDQNGKVLRNHKVNTIKQYGRIDPQDSPIRKKLTEEARKLFMEVWKLQQGRGMGSKFIFANKAGDVPQYSKIKQKYERTVKKLISEKILPENALKAYNMTHKIRKTHVTLGPIVAGIPDPDEMRRESVGHLSSEITVKHYVDHFIDGFNSPIPEAMGNVVKGRFDRKG